MKGPIVGDEPGGDHGEGADPRALRGDGAGGPRYAGGVVRRRRVLAAGLVICGCYAPPEVKVEEPPPPPPTEGRPERWVSPGVGPGVCAWRGHTFSPGDFAVVQPVADDVCFAYADCSWRVEKDGAAVRIEIEAEREAEPPLPFEISREEAHALAMYGRFTKQRVVDGWIAAFDAGEFGSGIWWFSPDWKRREKLIEEHVVGFFMRGDEVWAPGGLNHLGYTPGPVLRFARDAGGKWTATPTVEQLRAGAEVAMLEGDTILVATPLSVEAVDPKGGLRVLATVGWQAQYPNSMARGAKGELYVGMRFLVSRLTPDAAGRYVEDWLVPPPCKEWGFVKGMAVCACKELVGGDPLEAWPGWGSG